MNKVMAKDGTINCAFCKSKTHWPFGLDRRPILLTLSALHSWTANYGVTGEYEGDEIHLDSIAIPGATIAVLLQA